MVAPVTQGPPELTFGEFESIRRDVLSSVATSVRLTGKWPTEVKIGSPPWLVILVDDHVRTEVEAWLRP